MCQGCYSSWSLLNGRCPLDSPDLAEPARAHQSRVWPCIPDEVWINELWTSNSRITPHKSSNPARWNLQRTKKKNCWKHQHQPCHAPSLNIVTRTAAEAEAEEDAEGGYFKSLQLSDVWESTMNWAACQTASFTKQIETFDRTCLPFRETAHQQTATNAISYSQLADWFNLTNNCHRFYLKLKIQDDLVGAKPKMLNILKGTEMNICLSERTPPSQSQKPFFSYQLDFVQSREQGAGD